MSLPKLKENNPWPVYPLNNTYSGKLRISHGFILELTMEEVWRNIAERLGLNFVTIIFRRICGDTIKYKD